MNSRLLWLAAMVWLFAVGGLVYYLFNATAIDARLVLVDEQARRSWAERTERRAKEEAERKAEEAETARLREKIRREAEAENRARELRRTDPVGAAISEGRCIVVRGECIGWHEGNQYSPGQCVERNGKRYWCCVTEGDPDFDDQRGQYACYQGLEGMRESRRP